ncbi:hypothetical protein [Erwinia sorbitola]|uniref:Bacteriocin leader domain-containing protein n=1 Tax=Erwinia sorbitola TaxID=2681984 RepID=A0A6I6EC51_9GAMM|nr:hypothetical protein [Erwinia sorbitola]MTD26129.1 hypothetical protein [Erwinia sorbitola]QGU87334.1 hypothetical protein GN242_08960 [Erwinia sorbitola]
MKELSISQVEKVSGGFNFGSFLSAIGLKGTGKLVNAIETEIYDATFGKIPVVGPAFKDICTDFFGQGFSPSQSNNKPAE